MQIKSILAAAAIALAVTVGSASAADPFATLKGIPVEGLSTSAMAEVVGAAGITVKVNTVTIATNSTPPETITVEITVSGPGSGSVVSHP